MAEQQSNPKPVIFGLIFLALFILYAKKTWNARPLRIIKSHPLVKTDGRNLWVDFDRNGRYDRYFIRGVIYQPMPIGRTPYDRGFSARKNYSEENIYDNEKILNRDLPLLKKMNANTIRIWKANRTTSRDGSQPDFVTSRTLKKAGANDLKVIMGYLINSKDPVCEKGKLVYKAPDFADEKIRDSLKKSFVAFVNTYKNSPHVLFWAIGDGVNKTLNPLNFKKVEAWYSLANEMAKAAHEAEGIHHRPVALVNDGLTFLGSNLYGAEDHQLNHIDIWGVKVNPGETFDDLFLQYQELSEKPLWISEYGVDAFKALAPDLPSQGGEDQKTQAEWLGRLWDEIITNRTVTIGATVKEYSDEWWRAALITKKGNGSPGRHDTLGLTAQDTDCDDLIDWFPSMPDRIQHEEWWGIVGIEKRPQEEKKTTNDSAAPFGPSPPPEMLFEEELAKQEPAWLDIVHPREAYTMFQKRFACPSLETPIYSGPSSGRSCDGTESCCTNLLYKSYQNHCVEECPPDQPPPE